MKLFPAIDLKDNKCVRLTKGKDETSKIFNNNPIDQAVFFEQNGCKRIHIVDLDAAFGRNNVNTKTISEIRKATSIPIQIGGGIRSANDISRLFDMGLNYLIIGSLAIKDSETVRLLADSFKNKIYISLDVLHDKIMVNGWNKQTKLETKDVFKIYNLSNIRGYVLTDVENDGMLSGLNLKIIKKNLKLTTKKLIVGGGLGSYKDLENLNKISNDNLEGVIIGKAFYVGDIDLKVGQRLIN